ncbi:MAG: recombinase family protein [Gammaproteobacteria bacterium]
MAVFGYGRVGARDDSGDAQRADIERAGYAVDFWYADEGIGGRTLARERPQLRRLLDQIGDGETLVVARLDRLGRDAVDVSATVAALAARRIAVVVVQLERLDLTSERGRPCLTMLTAMAEMERDLLIERAQARAARARSEAVKPARVAKAGGARAGLRLAVNAGRDS